MRPLIVIGTTDDMRTALEPYSEVGHIEYHPTAEAAHFALLDADTRAEMARAGGGDPADHPMLATEDGSWDVHVAYGPGAYGSLAVGHNVGTHRLPHAGRTFVLAWNVDPDPAKPRRVMDGAVTGENPDTLPWQVSAVISADYVVDLHQPIGLAFLVRLLEWKDSAHT